MTISLGFEPYDIIAILSKGADWIWQITPPPGASSPLYPPDTQAQVLFYTAENEGLPPQNWDDPIAVYDGVFDDDDVIHFHVESDEADLIPDGALVRVHLIYANPPDDDTYLWGRGKVKRRD